MAGSAHAQADIAVRTVISNVKTLVCTEVGKSESIELRSDRRPLTIVEFFQSNRFNSNLSPSGPLSPPATYHIMPGATWTWLLERC